jgi:coenzyme F420 hydrogenase subunit beta
MKAVRDLIAYNDLKAKIIEPGFCTLCGACVAACPVGALKIEKNELCYLHDCSEDMKFCPICYDVCPHTETLLLETLGFVTDAPNLRENLGYYRKILLAQAVDEKLRGLIHSGGVVTALLRYAIDKGVIDSAVSSETTLETPNEHKHSISLVPDDILIAVSGKFSPSAVAMAFGRAVHEYGKTKIAFVGTPCSVLALRKLESWEHKIMNSLKIVIGLICLWSFSLPALLEYFAKTYKIEQSEIQKISLNKEYKIHTKDRVITVPLSEVKSHVLHGCRTCVDLTSELADISIGGASPLEDWSIVIIRTETGEKLFDDAVKDGIIRTKSIEDEPATFAHFMEMATQKRKAALEEITKREKAGQPIPPSVYRLRQLLPRELRFLSSLTVDQVMSKNLIAVKPETTVEEILSIMTKHHHMGYPVLDDKEQLMGIVTFEDILKIPSQQHSSTLAEKIAQKNPATVYPDDSILDVYNKMSKQRIERILVVDRNNPKKLLGIVTRTDVMHVFMWPMKLK